MKTLMVGAGIGGPTLALALEQSGMDYQQLEQAESIEEVGGLCIACDLVMMSQTGTIRPG